MPVPTSYFKQLIHTSVRTVWLNEWRAAITCRQTKLFIPKPTLSVSIMFLSKERFLFTIACQFITGHCYLRRHEALVAQGQDLDPTCRLCESAPETPWHLLAECPRLNSIRVQCFRQFDFNSGETPDLKKVFTFLQHTQIYDMLLKPIPAPPAELDEAD